MNSPNDTTVPPADSSRQALPGLDCSEQVAGLAKRSSSLVDFLRRLAEEFVTVFQTAVVAMVHPQWDGPMMLAQVQPTAEQLDGRSIEHLLLGSTSAPTACDLPLRVTDESQANRTRAIHVQLLDDQGVTSVLLVYDPRDIPDTFAQVRDLKRLGDYASVSRDALLDLKRSSLQTELHARQESVSDTADFYRSMREFHRDLDVRGTSMRIANESRRLLSVDRVSVLLKQRGRYRIEAVSGVAMVDRRANAVRAAEHFADRIVVLGRSIVLPCDDPLPEQVDQPFNEYLDESNVAGLIVIPLCRSAKGGANSDESTHPPHSQVDGPTGAEDPFGVILLESFDSQHASQISPAMRVVADEATIALGNAVEHHRIFGLRALKLMGDLFGRRLTSTALAFIAAAVLLVASILIEIDHKVIATGVAEPQVQQNVFARVDGVVKEVFVRDGQKVSKGDPLLRLENADLETTLESLTGEIQTSSKRLSSINALLLDPGSDPKQKGRMVIEQRQLESELQNLQVQLKLIRRQQDELAIHSPIDGTIAGWQLRRKLVDRPVSRGNLLLTVVESNGPWQLRLQIPDEDAAEVIDSLKETAQLEVEFAAASNPRSTFEAKLDSISTAARRNAAGENIIDAIARIIVEESLVRTLDANVFGGSDARSGVEATAKITCGQRSVLRSWFGDVADFFHRNVLFYFR